MLQTISIQSVLEELNLRYVKPTTSITGSSKINSKPSLSNPKEIKSFHQLFIMQSNVNIGLLPIHFLLDCPTRH